MTAFGDRYSKYYDLFYTDKDYCGEVDYVDALIKSHLSSAVTMLDLGCGTGKHAELFCKKGYQVHGVDISKDMLTIAESRRRETDQNLEFSHGNITDLHIGKKFDVVVALFHVMSYQTTNHEIERAFSSVIRHLNTGGLFVFDFWYGPAVLSDLPETRVKRREDQSVNIVRLAEPVMCPEKNIVEVHYDIFIQEKQQSLFTEQKEVHRMRYFFDPELEQTCEHNSMRVQSKYEWMTLRKPDMNSWNAVWVLKL